MNHDPSNLSDSSGQALRWLLVCDVDDTFLGDDSATRELIEIDRLSPQLGIALNSSRPIASVKATLEELPNGWRPVATITAMGTQIIIGGEIDESWNWRLEGWNRGPIDDLALRSGWTPHQPLFQTPLKASFTLPPGADWQGARQAIAALPMKSMVVISGAGDLDALPLNAGKGAATLHLAQRLGVEASHVVVAGDSANDIEMFRAVEKGIVVGNAREELRKSLKADENCFFATRACAGGIIEALRHFAIVPAFAYSGKSTQGSRGTT